LNSIRINGTTHSGDRVSTTFRIDHPESDTVGDLLAEVRRMLGGSVSTSVDAEGRLQVTDNQVGQSELTGTLVENNEGGGSLDFGSIDVEVEGRLGVEVTASNDAGRLVLQHRGYGSRNGFSVESSIAELGLVSGEYQGVDVAGTVNGEPAEGFGRILTGSSGNETTAGLSLRVTVGQDTLDQSGTERGTVSLVFGVARLLSDSLASITDSLDGTLKHRTEAIDDTIQNLDDRIADTQRRVEQYRTSLVRKFSALEGAMATLQSQGNFLSSQLAGLTSNS